MTSATQKALFHFGKWPIAMGEVFYTSALSYAVVNYKPVLPGHVLIVSKRQIARFHDLTAAEVADLWAMAQKVGVVVEKHFNADSLTFAVQDGTSAGQTVPHVHIHIIPRRSGDFANNDDIYKEVEALEKDQLGFTAEHAPKMDNDVRQPRSHAEMEAESCLLRPYFNDHFDALE